MNRTFIVLVFLLLALSCSAFGQRPSPTGSPQANDDTVKITTSLIQLDVVVTDKKGNIVTGLQPADFKVYQDGKLQTVTALSFVNSRTSEKNSIYSSKQKSEPKQTAPTPPTVRSKQGRIITFVLDDGNCLSTLGGMNTMRETMLNFVNRQMQPDDRVAVYRTTSGVSLLQVYTSNKDVLRRKIEKISLVSPYTCGSAFDAVSNNTTGKAGGVFESDRDKDAREARDAKQQRNVVLGAVGVLNFVVDRLMNIPQRKIIFLLSEGVISEDPFVRDALRELTEKAGRASIVINTLSTKGLTIPGMLEAQDSPAVRDAAQSTQVADARIKEENQLANGLAYIANATGGEFVRNKNLLEPEIDKVLETQTAYYLIGYEPEDETFKGKKFHRIEVKVDQPDVRVSYREGFYGQAASDSRPVYKNADSPLYQAIDSPLQENGIELQLTLLQGNSAANGSFIRPLFHINGDDLTFIDQADGSKKVVLDIVAVTLDEGSKVIDEFNRTYTTHIPREAVDIAWRNGLDFAGDMTVKKAGVYSFRIAVRDVSSKRVGTAGDYFEVDDIKKGKFSVGGLITTGIGTDGEPMMAKGRSIDAALSLVPDLSVPSVRRYTLGSTLYYAYTVYNAKIDAATQLPNLTRQVRLFQAGKLISDGPETPIPVAVPVDPLRINNFGSVRITDGVQPGEYALQIIVRDKQSNRMASQWIDFEVVP